MLLSILIGGLLVVILTSAAVLALVPAMTRRAVRVVLTRPMSDTLAELYVSLKSTPAIDFIYSSLRSQTGEIVIRPMGSARPVHGFDDLSLVPAQLYRAPIPVDEPVDLSVTIGASLKRPLTSPLPLYLSGMAYGLALTKNARLALARASGATGVPLNSGQGPFLQEERRLASRYVLQFGRWTWNRDPEILRQADMLEVQVGQGAMPGNAVVATPGEVSPAIHELMGLGPDEAPIIHARLFLRHPSEPASLGQVVDHLRAVADGVPIAVKMGAGQDLERDLDVALEAGVDLVVIDGTEGATGNAPITLSDHFGIPSLMALVRAVRHLEARGRRDSVRLAVSGGFREPGDILKALCLGADLVGIATIAMFALAHSQVTESVPLYPPTDLVFYRANPRIPLDVERGARGLQNFLESTRKEMELALRTMGHRSLAELSPRDVCALDPDIARYVGVPFSGDSPAPRGG
ncbi:MAG: FMN-binding glutamate synthase family protein [Clostridia bacterium]